MFQVALNRQQGAKSAAESSQYDVNSLKRNHESFAKQEGSQIFAAGEADSRTKILETETEEAEMKEKGCRGRMNPAEN